MTTKTCNKCKQEKPLDEFAKDANNPGGYKHQCKLCRKTYNTSYYAANKDKLLPKMREWQQNNPEKVKSIAQASSARHPDKSREYRADRRKSIKAHLQELKAHKGCAMCKENDPTCLEFHHLDPSTKKFTIARRSSGSSLKLLLAEIEKCVILCRNCHAKYHAW